MNDTDYVVATEDLFLGSLRAHFKGDLLPRESARDNDWDDVADLGTSAATSATAHRVPGVATTPSATVDASATVADPYASD